MPMQPQQSKELQKLHMTPPAKKVRGEKRRGSFMNDTETKKQKSERAEVDMDLDDSFAGGFIRQMLLHAHNQLNISV